MVSKLQGKILGLPAQQALPESRSFTTLGAMGKRTRLPVGTRSCNPLHGQAGTLAHGTRTAKTAASAVLVVLLLGSAVRSTRADGLDAVATPGPPALATPPTAVTPAAALPTVPTTSTQPSSGPAATVDRTGSVEEEQVRRGSAAVGPGARIGTGASSVYDLPRVIGALAAVIALIFLLRWLGRRFFALPTAQRSSRVVQVLSRSVLSPKQQLVLVRVGQRVLVAADNGSQLSPLSEITDPDEVALLLGQLQSEKEGGSFGMSSAKAFNSMFGRLKKTYGAAGDDEELLAGAANDSADAADDETDPNDPGERAELEDPEYAASLLSAASVSASPDNVVAATRHELNGLMEKVRMVSNQFGKT